MQKYLLLVIIAFLTHDHIVKAQKSEYLTIKSVAIDGTLNGFVSAMKQKGFNLLDLSVNRTQWKYGYSYVGLF